MNCMISCLVVGGHASDLFQILLPFIQNPLVPDTRYKRFMITSVQDFMNAVPSVCFQMLNWEITIAYNSLLTLL